MKLNPEITYLALIFPVIASAHGEESLLWVGIELLLLVCLTVGLYRSKLPTKCKPVIFFIYLTSVITATWVTSDIAYMKNILLVNSVTILVPVLTASLAWYLCAKKSKT